MVALKEKKESEPEEAFAEWEAYIPAIFVGIFLLVAVVGIFCGGCTVIKTERFAAGASGQEDQVVERETRYEPIALPVAVVPTSYIYPVVEVVNPVVYGYRPVVYRSYHRYYPAARVVHVHGRHEHYRRVHFYH